MDVKINGLTKYFESTKTLKDINVSLKSGEAHALVGPNGAGKTTLINCILGIYTKYEGNIYINGIDVQSNEIEKVRKRMSFVLDTTGLFVSLNAIDNIEFYDRLCNPGAKKAEREKRLESIFHTVSLKNREKDMIIKFSKGMKQRLALGRTMVNTPELMILDEPFQGLDVEGKILLTNYLLELKQKGCTILLSSHDLNEIEKICDRVSFIKKGEVIATQKIQNDTEKKQVHLQCKDSERVMEKLRKEPFVEKIEKRESGMDIFLRGDSNELLPWLMTNNVEIAELYSTSLKLEEIYKNTLM